MSTVSPAKCATCGVNGPARCVAGRRGWRRTGPEQCRRWYCPACQPPAEPAPVAAPDAAPAARATTEAPTEPFALLRWERDQASRADVGGPAFSVVAALRDLATKGP